jgi:hypothetical protein
MLVQNFFLFKNYKSECNKVELFFISINKNLVSWYFKFSSKKLGFVFYILFPSTFLLNGNNKHSLLIPVGCVRAKLQRQLQKFSLVLKKGFYVVLELIGLGFSVSFNRVKKALRFNIGYNHSVYYKINNLFGIFFKTKRKLIFIFSLSNYLLKSITTDLKNLRKLSVYKLKGIKQKDELYIKKN